MEVGTGTYVSVMNPREIELRIHTGDGAIFSDGKSRNLSRPSTLRLRPFTDIRASQPTLPYHKYRMFICDFEVWAGYDPCDCQPQTSTLSPEEINGRMAKRPVMLVSVGRLTLGLTTISLCICYDDSEGSDGIQPSIVHPVRGFAGRDSRTFQQFFYVLLIQANSKPVRNIQTCLSSSCLLKNGTLIPCRPDGTPTL